MVTEDTARNPSGADAETSLRIGPRCLTQYAIAVNSPPPLPPKAEPVTRQALGP